MHMFVQSACSVCVYLMEEELSCSGSLRSSSLQATIGEVTEAGGQERRDVGGTRATGDLERQIDRVFVRQKSP
jgi:hypothetical protein